MIHDVAQDFTTLLTQSLNDQQRQAVMNDNRGLLIIAGAGSGKTRVITSRIAHLIINRRVMPHTIVALTFTNKAAGEMKERLAKYFKGMYKMPFIGTFHSYCLQLLKTYNRFMPFTTFTIMDADDQASLIKKIMKKYAVTKQTTPTQVQYIISKYKNKIAVGSVVAQEIGMTSLIKEIYHEYETEKTNARCLDFDDLILYVLKLFQTQPEFKKLVQHNTRHILVDEYQDTSDVQHQLLIEMSTHDKKVIADSICAVGDEDQSIYSWRGATVANMLKFEHDFAPVERIKVEQNYRSVQPILEAANHVIAHNTQRNPKNLWSRREAKNRILLLSCQSGEQEAEAIAHAINLAFQRNKEGSCAVLYRTHFQSRTVEEALIHKSMPYKIIGGIRFYERKEIKDLLAYLRLIVNPFDKISLMRIINTPGRGLGEKFEENMLAAWAEQPFMDFRQLLQYMLEHEIGGAKGGKATAVQRFLNLYASLDAKANPSEILDTIISTTDYLGYLDQEYETQEAQQKVENVQELVQAIMVFERNSLSQANYTSDQNKTLLEAFLHDVSLMQEKIEDNSQQNVVQLMTLHAAKGLEFDTVILAGLEEGLLPSQKALNTVTELEEERRLMYVGMTRAREHLIICNAFSRFTFGQLVEQAPSRFLDELPQHLIHKIDLDNAPRYMVRGLLEEWLNGQIRSSTVKQVHSPYPRYEQIRNFSMLSEKAATGNSSLRWQKNQTVYHAKFGVGVVTEVEKAPDEDFYVTVLFRAGKKKILGKFLEKK